MAYERDRWRDRSIAAQNAANVAAHVLTPVFTADPSLATAEYFTAWQKAIYESSIALAGEDNEPAAPQARPRSSGGGGGGGGGGGKQFDSPGSIKFNFGKNKGMTIEEVDHSTDDRGEPGRGYLEWVLEKSNNDFIKKAIAQYLETADPPEPF